MFFGIVGKKLSSIQHGHAYFVVAFVSVHGCEDSVRNLTNYEHKLLGMGIFFS